MRNSQSMLYESLHSGLLNDLSFLPIPAVDLLGSERLANAIMVCRLEDALFHAKRRSNWPSRIIGVSVADFSKVPDKTRTVILGHGLH